jgi:hypothetical protein
MTIKHFTAVALLLSASAAQAIPIQWTIGAGANGHWYEFVPTPADWATARTLALASSWLGESGYLTNVTSAEENVFVSTVVAQGALAWLGGSDEWNRNNEADEGKWKWMDGPEAGRMFWNSGVTQIYANWNPGEPNNCCGGEDYLQINWGPLGGWNDHGGPGNRGQQNGHVVEYAGTMPAATATATATAAAVPEPGTLALAVAAFVGLGLTRRRRG